MDISTEQLNTPKIFLKSVTGHSSKCCWAIQIFSHWIYNKSPMYIKP